ncbi:uncharacterized protein LOC108742437 isoform X2 [Agrilus planipennis]|uniref:Uncharacterized protein LOC108742437 isoform X2 n=1 Tax=Agrilus planipennis TaxID=224129 RepID=A0A1W4XK47_AGRPL|nr:uncharacterized protein LOC108742437 isoform X2 [Agrilus planipennis]
MCKSCQYCLESCYWNLIEKHFCFDEEIALYTEESSGKDEKNNNLYDNLAFYDKVAIIAGRSIVTIDPLPSKTDPPTPVISQPPRRIRWWEDDVDEQNRKNEEKIVRHAQSNEELSSQNKNQESENIPQLKIEPDREKSKSSIDISTTDDKSKKENELPIISRLKPAEENLASSSNNSSRSSLDEKPKIRKKSLRERRMSRSLTLDIERALELPIIKQQSMPKFYVDSPDASRLDISGSPSSVLVSPRIRKESKAYEYDLRSVVQIENEKKKKIQQHAPIHKQMSQSKLQSIKDKLIRPQDKLKHQFSTGSLPNVVNYI